MNRRDFLAASLTATLTASAVSTARLSAADGQATPAPTGRRRHKKGFMYSMLRGDSVQKLTVKDRFALLRDAGFDGVEVMSAMSQEEVLAAKAATGLEIPSVIVATHWAKPLTDANPETRRVGYEGVEQALRDAKAYGASSVLLVPGQVTKEVSYVQAYERSREAIQRLVPLAVSLGVTLAIENVWNRFLLSPREAVEYVDSFQSPRVQWHLDIGNLVNFGWPEQWVEQLGRRIVKVHVKEYSRKLRDTKGPFAGFEVDLLEGDSDWPAVMAALDRVGYAGWMITEQWRPPGLDDAGWLVHLSKKLDQVLAS